ncbi:glycosyltransferase [Porphyromonas uenonis]|uniref:glycosyltransferase n=1 Tax=Porphyromonas uenonis TaxID=281920 RepID=UPI0026E9DFDF|nr:glycosyltransferase [Porphyromonas uenonis]
MRQILLILPTDSLKGGAETVLHLIAKELVADSDTQITVAFLTGRVYHGWDRLGELPNVSLIFTQSQSVWCGMPKLILNLIRLRGHKFDICFTSHTDMTGVAGLLKRLRVLSIQTLVARESCSVFLRYKRPPLRFRIHHTLGYPAVNLLICQTQMMKEQFVQGAPQLAKRIQAIEVLPNPIDLAQINDATQKSVQTCLSPSYRYIVAAGRLIPIKGYDLLIKAFSLLHKESQFEDTRLVILGEGASRQTLETLIHELQLEHAVELRGNVENVYPYFRQATLCVISSRMEGFPNVLLQMMSQCDNVVSTVCAGGIDQIAGLITCEPNNVDALYQAMKHALETEDTAKNRPLFDQELESRSISSFIAKIELAASN